MIATDLALALDPVALWRKAGIEPDPWQAALLRADDPRILLNCCRQSGKSTTAATRAVHTITFRPGSLVIMLAPALRQSSELFKKAAGVYRSLDRPVPSDSETALTVTLQNGSRLVALPGSEATVRGFSGVAELIIDEASRVPDDLYHAVRPMLSVSKGRLIVMSTPWGRRGFFHREWTEGGPTWRRFRVPAADCPRHTPEFLAEERASMPSWFYDQEYDCDFRDTTATIFPSDLIASAISSELVPLFGGVEAGDTTAEAPEPAPALWFGGTP